MSTERLTEADLEAAERLYELGLFGTGNPTALIAEVRAAWAEVDEAQKRHRVADGALLAALADLSEARAQRDHLREVWKAEQANSVGWVEAHRKASEDRDRLLLDHADVLTDRDRLIAVVREAVARLEPLTGLAADCRELRVAVEMLRTALGGAASGQEDG
jgi:F0F1-type ATP synthase membrane subunit b/b'